MSTLRYLILLAFNLSRDSALTQSTESTDYQNVKLKPCEFLCKIIFHMVTSNLKNGSKLFLKKIKLNRLEEQLLFLLFFLLLFN